MDESPRRLLVVRQFLQRYAGRLLVCSILIGMLYFIVSFYSTYRREQRIAERIESLGGEVFFVSCGPTWVRDSLEGHTDYFYRIREVRCTTELPSDLVADLATLRHVLYFSFHGREVSNRNLRDFQCLKRVISIWGEMSDVTDDGLLSLKGSKYLSSLSLHGSSVSDAGLRHLEELPDLFWIDVTGSKVTGLDWTKTRRHRGLNLRETQITDRSLERLKDMTSLQWLYLDKTAISDAGLKHVEGLTGLEELGLESTNVTDRGIECLRKMPNLRTLLLAGTQVTDAGIELLKVHTALDQLTLGSAVTDKGLEHLKGMKVLVSLDLSDSQITDAGIDTLNGIANLRMLALDGTRITDEALSRITVPYFVRLSLNRTGLTDSGLKHLKRLQINQLSLNDTLVTDDGLETLKEIAPLFEVSLSGTRVTTEGVAALRLALPECRVTFP